MSLRQTVFLSMLVALGLMALVAGDAVLGQRPAAVGPAVAETPVSSSADEDVAEDGASTGATEERMDPLSTVSGPSLDINAAPVATPAASDPPAARPRSSSRTSSGKSRPTLPTAGRSVRDPMPSPPRDPTPVGRSSIDGRVYALPSAEPPTRYSTTTSWRRPTDYVDPSRVYSDYTRRVTEPDPVMDGLLKEDADLERQAHDAAVEGRDAKTDEEKTKARTMLEELTKKHFEVRQQRRELEISRLEEQLARVKAALKKRSDNQELIIQRRVAKLLGEEDELAF